MIALGILLRNNQSRRNQSRISFEVILDLQSATVLVFNRERPKCGSLFALHLASCLFTILWTPEYDDYNSNMSRFSQQLLLWELDEI